VTKSLHEAVNWGVLVPLHPNETGQSLGVSLELFFADNLYNYVINGLPQDIWYQREHCGVIERDVTVIRLACVDVQRCGEPSDGPTRERRDRVNEKTSDLVQRVKYERVPPDTDGPTERTGREGETDLEQCTRLGKNVEISDEKEIGEVAEIEQEIMVLGLSVVVESK